MIKNLTVGDIVKQSRSLGVVANLKLSMNVSLKLAKMLSEAQTIIDKYNERQKELSEQLITKPEEGVEVDEKVAKKEQEALIEALDEILDEEIEFEVPEIKVADLGDAKIEPSVLMNIRWLFVDAD